MYFDMTQFVLVMLFFGSVSSVQVKYLGGSLNNEPSGVCGSRTQFSSSFFPGGREQHVSTELNVPEKLFLFGGRGFDTEGHHGEMNDAWIFNYTSNEWAWWGGINGLVELGGVYGTRKEYSTSHYPGGRVNPAIWKVSSEEVLIYGGRGYDQNTVSGNLGDLWSYDVPANKWAFLRGHRDKDGQRNRVDFPGEFNYANKPSSRCRGGFWKTEEERYFLFGGYGRNDDTEVNNGHLMDMWELSFIEGDGEWEWKFVKGFLTNGILGNFPASKHYFSSSSYPGSRRSFAFWLGPPSDSLHTLMIFGGHGCGEFECSVFLNDLWTMRTTDFRWKWDGGSGEADEPLYFDGKMGEWSPSYLPESRKSTIQSSWADYENDVFYLMFGQVFEEPMEFASDIWAFRTSDYSWKLTYGDPVVFNYFSNVEGDGYHPKNQIGGVRYAALWKISNSTVVIHGGYGSHFVDGDTVASEFASMWEISAFECFGKVDDVSDEVCSGGNGYCLEEDFCDCKDYFYFQNCSEEIYCGEVKGSSSKVCGGHGDCIVSDESTIICDGDCFVSDKSTLICVCDHGYVLDYKVDQYECLKEVEMDDGWNGWVGYGFSVGGLFLILTSSCLLLFCCFVQLPLCAFSPLGMFIPFLGVIVGLYYDGKKEEETNESSSESHDSGGSDDDEEEVINDKDSENKHKKKIISEVSDDDDEEEVINDKDSENKHKKKIIAEVSDDDEEEEEEEEEEKDSPGLKEESQKGSKFEKDGEVGEVTYDELFRELNDKNWNNKMRDEETEYYRSLREYCKSEMFNDYIIDGEIKSGAYGVAFQCRLKKYEEIRGFPGVIESRDEKFVIKVFIDHGLKEELRLQELPKMFKNESLTFPYHYNLVIILDSKKVKQDNVGLMKSQFINELKKKSKSVEDFDEEILPYMIVMKFYHTDLDKLLEVAGKLSMFQLLKIFWGVVNGATHLYMKDIVHRDLHSGNIFIDPKTLRVWIGDFGCSIDMRNNLSHFKVPAESREERLRICSRTFQKVGYDKIQPPEIKNAKLGEKLDYEKYDVYSVGILLMELLKYVDDENLSANDSKMKKYLSEELLGEMTRARAREGKSDRIGIVDVKKKLKEKFNKIYEGKDGEDDNREDPKGIILFQKGEEEEIEGEGEEEEEESTGEESTEEEESKMSSDESSNESEEEGYSQESESTE